MKDFNKYKATIVKTVIAFLITNILLIIPITSWFTEVLEKAFKKEYGNGILVPVCFIINFALALLVYNIYFTIKNSKIENKGVKFKSEDGTFGTADWSTLDEISEVLSVGKNDGAVIGITEEGKAICIPEQAKINKNVAVFGSSGSMKTRAFAIVNILQIASLNENKSIICTDPKAELYKKTCRYLEKRGYIVKLLNLVNPKFSDAWNPILDVENETDAQVFAEVVIANTQLDRSKGGDEFWTRTEQNLLKALILHIAMEVEDEREKNMGYLYSILASGDLKSIDDVFKTSSGATRLAYNIYKQATDMVKQSIVTRFSSKITNISNR